jgi:hypothetical protein
MSGSWPQTEEANKAVANKAAENFMILKYVEKDSTIELDVQGD